MMKKCPFCAEDIQDAAIKCKHCGEFLDGSGPSQAVVAKEKRPWWFRTSFIIIAFFCVGPLALPLIWWRPQTSRAWKIGLTIAIIIISAILLQATIKSVETLEQYYSQYYELMGR